jgi:hypothetical protein
VDPEGAREPREAGPRRELERAGEPQVVGLHHGSLGLIPAPEPVSVTENHTPGRGSASGAAAGR